jgi:hypothetical protein
MYYQKPHEILISNPYSQVVYLFRKNTPASNDCLPRAKAPDAVGQESEKHRGLICRPDGQSFAPSVAELEHICAVIASFADNPNKGLVDGEKGRMINSVGSPANPLKPLA